MRGSATNQAAACFHNSNQSYPNNSQTCHYPERVFFAFTSVFYPPPSKRLTTTFATPSSFQTAPEPKTCLALRPPRGAWRPPRFPTSPTLRLSSGRTSSTQEAWPSGGVYHVDPSNALVNRLQKNHLKYGANGTRFSEKRDILNQLMVLKNLCNFFRW